MGFNDDNFLDDYEIQELINKFESQLESGMPLFFDADELNIILEHYVQKNDIPKINIIAVIVADTPTAISVPCFAPLVTRSIFPAPIF